MVRAEDTHFSGWAISRSSGRRSPSPSRTRALRVADLLPDVGTTSLVARGRRPASVSGCGWVLPRPGHLPNFGPFTIQPTTVPTRVLLGSFG
jgi:hypothetical protein